MDNSQNEPGDLKDEYLEVGANMRQFGNIRFAQLTLFVAISAGLFTMLFQWDQSFSSIVKMALKIIGLLVTIIFWIMDQRAMEYWNYFRKRAIDLEKLLKFKQYFNAPAKKFLSTTNAMRALFFGIIIMWVVVIFFN